MADGFDIKLTGFAQLHDALGEFKKTTERGVLRRVGLKALQPIVDHARELAPVADGNLKKSIVAGTKLTRNAKSAAKADPKQGVRVFAGTANRNAVPREFGSSRSRAEPFLRPAWDAGKAKVAQDAVDMLGDEIEKTRKRAAARAAKQKG